MATGTPYHALATLAPPLAPEPNRGAPDAPLTALFTSGSTGLCRRRDSNTGRPATAID